MDCSTEYPEDPQQNGATAYTVPADDYEDDLIEKFRRLNTKDISVEDISDLYDQDNQTVKGLNHSESIYGFETGYTNDMLRCVFYNCDDLLGAQKPAESFTSQQEPQPKIRSSFSPIRFRNVDLLPSHQPLTFEANAKPLLERQNSFEQLLEKFSYKHYKSRPPTAETGAIPKQYLTSRPKRSRRKHTNYFSICVYGDSISEEFLLSAFSIYGKILEVFAQPDTNRGWVTFARQEHAKRAVDEINCFKNTDYRAELTDDVPICHSMYGESWTASVINEKKEIIDLMDEQKSVTEFEEFSYDDLED